MTLFAELEDELFQKRGPPLPMESSDKGKNWLRWEPILSFIR